MKTRVFYYLVVALSAASVSAKFSSIGEILTNHDAGQPIHRHDHPLRDGSVKRMTIQNMNCSFFTQPLNHFVPRGRSPSYDERYCEYNGYARENSKSASEIDETTPIFFYTGNESPLEQYINQTGLIWELAPKFGARVVFVEHRYEGQSLPNISKDCMSYASTMQALEDYARILDVHLNPGNKAPVIVFGGSYGGMLSAWMRMKYPHLVVGAIAASAPIGAFPQYANDKIDSSARVVASGLDLPYPPTKFAAKESISRIVKAAKKAFGIKTQPDEKNHCRNNLLAAWPLITWLARQEGNGEFLQQTFSLCEPLKKTDAPSLLRWAQGIWFDLAEGSFPYPSSYIPFALLHERINLPAWPLQAACWQGSQLHKDWGVKFDGDLENVKYRVNYGEGNLSLAVDWDQVVAGGSAAQAAKIQQSNDIVGLLTSVRNAVSIWYNITKNVSCYNISQVAPNSRSRTRISKKPIQRSGSDHNEAAIENLPSNNKINPARICSEEMRRVGSWEPLCCNDEMNLVITEARGLGSDFFWPPSLPRGVDTYRDMIQNSSSSTCPDPYDVFGYSNEPYNLWSTRLDTYYGGANMNGHSNIILSNGLLDPWSAGGVYKDDLDLRKYPLNAADTAIVQNVTANDILALIIPYGGHHTDLMYGNEMDPDCVREAREIEEHFISKWMRDWSSQNKMER